MKEISSLTLLHPVNSLYQAPVMLTVWLLMEEKNHTEVLGMEMFSAISRLLQHLIPSSPAAVISSPKTGPRSALRMGKRIPQLPGIISRVSEALEI